MVADSREVYAWPEATLYLYAGTASGIFAWAENIELSFSRDIKKYTFMTTGVPYGARVQMVQTEQNVEMTIGRLFAGPSLWQLFNSGVNISATVNFSAGADGASSTFAVYSAQANSYRLQGRDAGVWRDNITLIAPDISGL